MNGDFLFVIPQLFCIFQHLIGWICKTWAISNEFWRKSMENRRRWKISELQQRYYLSLDRIQTDARNQTWTMSASTRPWIYFFKRLLVWRSHYENQKTTFEEFPMLWGLWNIVQYRRWGTWRIDCACSEEWRRQNSHSWCHQYSLGIILSKNAPNQRSDF